MTAHYALRSLVLAGLLGAMVPTIATGEDFALPLVGPLPSARPLAMTSGIAIDPARFGSAAAPAPNPVAAAPLLRPANASAFTASVGAISARPSDVRPVKGGLRDALQAVSDGDVRKARAVRDGMMPGSLDRHILAWAIALRGGRDVPASEIAQAANELSGWPGMKSLRENSEKALYREEPPARQVVAAFGAARPETPEGAMALARAYLELGDAGKAKSLVAGVWREERLGDDLERRMLKSFGTLLTRADHKYRMDKLLYAERVTDAGRAAALAGTRQIFNARVAVIRGERNAAKLLAAVPAEQRGDPGYLFARVENLRKSGKSEEAAALLLKAPRERSALIDPDAWWNERRIIARDLLDLGKPRQAYLVASAHSAESSSEAVEAEFHSGWIALRFLNDPATAYRHFARIESISSKPLSLSRGYYWLGRAAEAGGPGNASSFYGKAAVYGATYYGQLAAAKLNRRPSPIAFPQASAADRQRFTARESVQAIQRLEEIGSDWRAASLYRDLADELQSPGELALLSVMAERKGDHSLVLQVGKLAYWRGIDAPALAFPIGVIPAAANISAAGKALAYAIARQESAFNPRARSPAGALGLLQLMPGTAKTMARKAGLAYSADRLTSDPAYNATLGARFLGEQIADFGGSYVLTFAAYNAGPRRAREWIGRFGDPRGRQLDEVVDWVERIPFTETRNYVQRVMENYQVYKMRLGADTDIARDLRLGRG